MSLRSNFGFNFHQAFAGFREDVVRHAKHKPEFCLAELRTTVETGPRDTADTDFFNQPMCKRCIVRKSEIGDVCHNVISTLWLLATESGFCQVLHEKLAIFIILRDQRFMVTSAVN